MVVSIARISAVDLPRYAQVPTAFVVRVVLRPRLLQNGLGGIMLEEETLDTPYVKNYDASGEDPTTWPRDFDVSEWAFWLAQDGETPVGAAAALCREPSIHLLGDRDDAALLWDIRVHPAYRGQGVGTRLVELVKDWSRAQQCAQLLIETQNVNIAACRFYLARGCRLACIDRSAYAAHPAVAHEVQLVWALDL